MPSKPDAKYIWQYDYNYRVYQDDDGLKSSTPNYRKQWRRHEVVEETSRSWVLDNGVKVPKNGKNVVDKQGHYMGFAFSEDEVNDRVYRHDHAQKIAEEVRKADAETLRMIAELIGYQS
jgi:hypothetical protein